MENATVNDTACPTLKASLAINSITPEDDECSHIPNDAMRGRRIGTWRAVALAMSDALLPSALRRDTNGWAPAPHSMVDRANSCSYVRGRFTASGLRPFGLFGPPLGCTFVCCADTLPNDTLPPLFLRKSAAEQIPRCGIHTGNSQSDMDLLVS